MSLFTRGRPRPRTAARAAIVMTAAVSAAVTGAIAPASAAPAPAGSAQAAAVPVPVAAAAPVAAPAAGDRTSEVEARRVDRVPTPRLGWYDCYGYARCATVKLPLDYDDPRGPTTEVAVLKVEARKPAKKIGSLFVNPGGPGGSSTELALLAPAYLSDSMLDRFDVVGVDPRGIGASEQVKCFPSAREQTAALKGLQVAFPYDRAEEKAYTASAEALGRGCSSTGKPLSGAMSTAEVARDMDVVRRAVGDKKLTYLGFSYGSVLGQYYANMFPDRVRSLAIDGVVNPVSWVGSPTPATTVFDRLRSADGASKALRELLERCDRAGGQRCSFAAGDPVANFDLVAERLKKNPVTIQDPEAGEINLTYVTFISAVLGALYSPAGPGEIADTTAQLLVLTEPPAPASAAADQRSQDRSRRAAARTGLARQLTAWREQARAALGFPYDNSAEAQTGVICTDSREPADAGRWPALAAAADARAPYFGRPWTYPTAPCARNTWTVRDEDAYTGPFTRRTASPVLVVGNFWDPATNYQGAVDSTRLLPGSRLLASDSWGHTAYGTSACATTAIDTYLLTQALPAKGTTCIGDVQPFAAPTPAPARTRPATTSKDEAARLGRPRPGAPKQLPPVTPGAAFSWLDD
jgi:pimeloyl-ACP methyl ester carboxylesterase